MADRTTSRAHLGWQPVGEISFWGSSGDLLVAPVIRPSFDNPSGRWRWKIDVSIKHADQNEPNAPLVRRSGNRNVLWP
jgi:hypothetical protein